MKEEIVEEQQRREQLEKEFPSLDQLFTQSILIDIFDKEDKSHISYFFHEIIEVYAPFTCLQLGFNFTSFNVVNKNPEGKLLIGVSINDFLTGKDSVVMYPVYYFSSKELILILETLKQQQPVFFNFQTDQEIELFKQQIKETSINVSGALEILNMNMFSNNFYGYKELTEQTFIFDINQFIQLRNSMKENNLPVSFLQMYFSSDLFLIISNKQIEETLLRFCRLVSTYRILDEEEKQILNSKTGQTHSGYIRYFIKSFLMIDERLCNILENILKNKKKYDIIGTRVYFFKIGTNEMIEIRIYHKTK